MRLGASRTLVVVGVVGLLAAACGGGKPAATTGATSAPPTTAPVTTSPGTTAPATTTTPSGPVTTSTGAGLPFQATLVSPTQTPKVLVPWRYVLRVTDLDGKPIKARITVQVVDPLQQPHPVEYDGTTRNLIAWPIDGVFRDDVEWPADARGFTLTFRVIVKAKGVSARLDVPVTVQ